MDSTLTIKEIAGAVKLTESRIRQLRLNNVITGIRRGGVWFFAPEVISIISKRGENRGRKRKIKELT